MAQRWTFSGLLRHFSRKLGSFALTAFGYRLKAMKLFDGQASYAVGGMDLELTGIVGKRKGFYCELGAFDGIRQSNTLFLELYRDWNGILIEPVHENFEKLRKNRSSQRNKLIRAAAVGFDYQDSFMPIAVGGLMSSPMAGKTDVADSLNNARIGRSNQRIFSKSPKEPPIELCPAFPLTAIFDREGCPRVIDLLSLDVEGGELEVLKGIDFARYRINWIVVESRNPEQMTHYLVSKGFEFVRFLTPLDMLFRFSLEDLS